MKGAEPVPDDTDDDILRRPLIASHASASLTLSPLWIPRVIGGRSHRWCLNGQPSAGTNRDDLTRRRGGAAHGASWSRHLEPAAESMMIDWNDVEAVA
jgi:hypothetical protein